MKLALALRCLRGSRVYLPKLMRVLAALLIVTGCALPMWADQSIILRSGNGSVGTQDAQVRFLAYGRGGDITPSAADFQAVQSGTFAYIDQPYSTYIQSLPTDPLAHWISTTPNLGAGSALYAIPFTVTDSIIGSASLDLGYAVDNAINGVYINGTLISGNSHDGDYHGEYYELRSDIVSLLKPNAVNWLYINTSDYGGLAGVIFNATIMVQGGSAATPSISPNQGGNAGQVTVSVIGSGFQPAQPDSTGSQIRLSGVGPDITGTNVTVVGPGVLTATFNLNSAPVGIRTVTVTTPGETPVAIPGAFTVLGGGSSGVTVDTVSTPSVLGRIEFFFITVTNIGNFDSGPTAVTAALEPWSTLLTAIPTPDTIEPLIFPVKPYQALLTWNIPNIPPGRVVILTYSAEQDKTFPVGETVIATACTAYQLSVINGYCAGQLQANLILEDTLCSSFPNIGESCVKPVVKDFGTYAKCMQTQGAKCGGSTTMTRASVDPNDLTGPPGGGTQGWFQDNQPLEYTLSFNNLPTATNPATDVYLTDTFDPSTMDLSSLTVGAISVGGLSYSPPDLPLAGNPFTHDIDLRPAQNLLVRVSASLDQAASQVNMSLLSLDPSTGLIPADPTIGFLPPGAGGSVLYSLNSKSGLSTGTAVKDNASVVFDSNAAIKAPQWLNTVDTIPPVSHVVALPATETSTTFNVSWTGTDIGSGIEYYSIYVSDNNGPFTEWLTDTTATSSTYTGTIGHSYAFYSISEDFATNQESSKTVGDTSTQVVANNVTTTTTLIANPNSSLVAGEPITLTATVVPVSGTAVPTGTVTFADPVGGSVTRPLDSTGKAVYTGVVPRAGTYSVFATYNGTAGFTTSTSATITRTVTPAAPR